jgi:hypothetical protein
MRLIGGADPKVKAAGIVEIRGGKIHSIDNASGHYKPGAACLSEAKGAFGKLNPKIFKDFEGYLNYAKTLFFHLKRSKRYEFGSRSMVLIPMV